MANETVLVWAGNKLLPVRYIDIGGGVYTLGTTPLDEAGGVAAGPVISTVSTQVRKASSATSIELAAANTSRNMLTIVNKSTQLLYVKKGTGASITGGSESFNYEVAAGQTLEFPPPMYVGVVHGIWVSENGYAMVSEDT